MRLCQYQTLTTGSMSLQEDAVRAGELREVLLNSLHYFKNEVVTIGRALAGLKYKNIYKKAQGDMTWRDFLAQPEIGISERDAAFYIKYADLVDNNEEWQEAPLATARVALARTDNVSDLSDMLDDAKVLTTKDFKERYHELKTNDAPKTYTYMVMKKCVETGNMTKEHKVKSEEIETTFKDKLC